jgi:protein SCO1/2
VSRRLHDPALATLLCVALLACGDWRGAPTGAPLEAERLPADSLYQIDGDWQDERGEGVRLDLWRGHVTAVVLFFGTCEATCPALVHELQRIETELPEDARAQLRALLVTIDPERDTSEALAAYAREHGLPVDRWRLLRGDAASVRTLAAALGVRYRRLPGGQFNHSLQIAFLDRDGAIAHRVERLGEPVDAAALLLAEEDGA